MRFIYPALLLLLFACKRNEAEISGILKEPSVLVVNGGDNSLSVIDPDTFEERHRLFISSPLNTYIHHIGVSPDRRRFAFALPEYDFSGGHDGLHGLAAGGHVVIFNRDTERNERTITVPFANHNAVFSPDGSEIWTGLVSHSGRVLVYNAANGSLIREITVGADPHEVIFSGRYVLVTCLESSFLTVIDPVSKSIVREVKVDPFPTNVWPGKDPDQVIVENATQKSLNFVDLNRLQVTDHLDLPFAPGFAAFDPDGNLWICGKGQNFLYVYRKNGESWEMAHRIATQNDPHHFIFLEDNLWLVNQKQNTVEIFNTASKEKIRGISTGLKPNAIIYVP